MYKLLFDTLPKQASSVVRSIIFVCIPRYRVPFYVSAYIPREYKVCREARAPVQRWSDRDVIKKEVYITVRNCKEGQNESLAGNPLELQESFNKAKLGVKL